MYCNALNNAHFKYTLIGRIGIWFAVLRFLQAQRRITGGVRFTLLEEPRRRRDVSLPPDVHLSPVRSHRGPSSHQALLSQGRRGVYLRVRQAMTLKTQLSGRLQLHL